MMIQFRHMAILAALAVSLVSGAASSLAAPLPAVGQVAKSERKTCAEPIRKHEREAGIPNQLLAAVALAESGRWDKTDSASFAWPWTVTAEGKGQFFATKAEAIKQVEQLRARGVRNIDVGCMQINLLHHPDAFSNLEEALDPQANVAYATSFLKQLFEQSRSWLTAVGNYHSATPEFHMRYRQKVTKLWNGERRRDAEARRQDTITAYQQRRMAATAAGETQVAAADIGDALEVSQGALPRQPTQRPANGAITSHPHLAPTIPPMPHGPAPATSLRVQSQIPSAAAMRSSAADAAAAGRIAPRATAVPMERRF